MRCEPANTIIKKFGGLSALAEVVGKAPHTVMRWRMPKAKGGTDGIIPHWHHEAIVDAAVAREIDLSETGFVAVRANIAAPIETESAA